MAFEMLLACALSDAHGLPVENLSPRRIRAWFPKGMPAFAMLGGRGVFSDDTEHAALTAQAYCESAGEQQAFEKALARHLRWWFLAMPPATGLATGRALIKLCLGVPPSKSGVSSAGNGPCMRAPILGLLVDDPDHLWTLVNISSRMTHTDPRAIQGAYVLARWVQLARQLNHAPTMEQLLDGLPWGYVPVESHVRHVVQGVKASLARNESLAAYAASQGWAKGPTGFVLQTLAAVLHVVSGFDGNWERSVRQAVCLGGDTDSIAALVGSVLSVLPQSSPPPAWLAALNDWPRSNTWLVAVEKAAVVSSATTRAVLPPKVGYLSCLVRNLGFLGVVLFYGARRMLPPY